MKINILNKVLKALGNKYPDLLDTFSSWRKYLIYYELLKKILLSGINMKKRGRKRGFIIISILSGVVLNFYLPLLDNIITLIELVLICLIIRNLDMMKYREIYNKMDKSEQRLVHKLLGLIATGLIIPIYFLVTELYESIVQ